MTWGERFVATNCRGQYEDHFVSGYLIDRQYGAVVHQITPDGLWRHTYAESLDLPEEGIEQRMAEYFRVVLPDEGFDHEIVQWRHYRMHQRSAETYRVGRALLAGDAAHITNPTRGFGLVGGMFDAFTLTEALVAILLDGSDDALLDEYARARKQVFWDYTTPISSESKRLVFEPTEERLEGFRRVAADREDPQLPAQRGCPSHALAAGEDGRVGDGGRVTQARRAGWLNPVAGTVARR
jgi:3-(3-hydroxy-phenyl)propionate hydroxylase/6-hydroxy-3-succinoylpyridine 3-monooxygenase